MVHMFCSFEHCLYVVLAGIGYPQDIQVRTLCAFCVAKRSDVTYMILSRDNSCTASVNRLNLSSSMLAPVAAAASFSLGSTPLPAWTIRDTKCQAWFRSMPFLQKHNLRETARAVHSVGKLDMHARIPLHM